MERELKKEINALNAELLAHEKQLKKTHQMHVTLEEKKRKIVFKVKESIKNSPNQGKQYEVIQKPKTIYTIFLIEVGRGRGQVNGNIFIEILASIEASTRAFWQHLAVEQYFSQGNRIQGRG